MPYLLYRMDVSRNELGQAQPVRFRAQIISDRMNVMDEIDVACQLSEDHIPSPEMMDRQWVSPKDLEAADLAIDMFMDEVREWIDHQQEKRRGQMVFVPSRGVEIDQLSLQEMMERYSEEGFYFYEINDPKVLDIQEYANDVIIDRAIPRPANNDDVIPTDLFTVFYDLSPVQYLPFHMEVGAPGTKTLPAFTSSYEMLKWAHEKDKQALSPELLPSMYPFVEEVQDDSLKASFNQKSDYQEGDILSLVNNQGKYQHFVVAGTKEHDGQKHFALIRVDNIEDSILQKKKKRHLLSDFLNEKGMVRIVSHKDLLGCPIVDENELDKVSKTVFKNKKEIVLSTKFQNEVKNTFKAIFNDNRKVKKLEDFSKNIRPSALLSVLLNNAKSNVFGFEDAEKEVQAFDDLPGDATRYQAMWRNYLEKRKKTLQSKITF